MASEHIDTPQPGSYTAMCEQRERVLSEQLTVRQIVAAWLTAHGYSGLYDCNSEDGCGCRLDDLMPCESECALDCLPGYAVYNTDGEFLGVFEEAGDGTD